MNRLTIAAILVLVAMTAPAEIPPDGLYQVGPEEYEIETDQDFTYRENMILRVGIRRATRDLYIALDRNRNGVIDPDEYYKDTFAIVKADGTEMAVVTNVDGSQYTFVAIPEGLIPAIPDGLIFVTLEDGGMKSALLRRIGDY